MVTPTKSLRRAIAVLGFALLLTAMPSSSASADRPGRQPGLPYVECSTDLQPDPCFGDAEYTNTWTWLNTPQVGMTGSVRSKQWARIPLTMLATSTEFVSPPPPGTPPYPPGTPLNDWHYKVRSFFTSPKGSQHNYGDSALISVRTVAFGSIPVEITLQVSQRRDASDLPIPLVLRMHDTTVVGNPDTGVPSTLTIYPATFEELVNVRVRALSVDGVDVGLHATCQTGPTAKIHAVSKLLEGDVTKVESKVFDPAVYLYGLNGGTLNGTVDIPPFSGCTTKTGDDISPILTSAITGTGNPLTIRVGALNCQAYGADGAIPNPPGVNSPDDPDASCYPSTHPNPKVVTVPKPVSYPDYAPGKQPTT